MLLFLFLSLVAHASSESWGLESISAYSAHALSTGAGVRVEVIDTGVDFSSIPGVIASNLSYDFVTETVGSHDIVGHGTHVAGIIAQVAPKAELLSARCFDDKTFENQHRTIKSIDYAIKNKVQVINYSAGGDDFSEQEFSALKRAEAQGILFVSAAGNEHKDTGLVENYYYPCAYKLSNMICVAAIDIRGSLYRGSNWGGAIDLAAPGENIFSTLPSGRKGYMTGTSMATAFVSGVAALLFSGHPGASATEIKRLILESVDGLPSLAGKVSSGGKVNAYQALEHQKRISR